MTDSSTLPAQIGPYRNRIIGLRVMPAGELADNPRNWRKHPPAQAQGLDAVMRRIGVIDVVRYNEPTNRLWDGHLRKKLFAADPHTPVIVLVTDLSEDEEAVALATFDTLTGMARADSEMLLALLRLAQDAPVVDGQRAVLFATDPPYVVDYDATNHPHAWNKTDTNNCSANRAC